MFVKAQQHPDVEFNPVEGQTEPTLVHYFSNKGDPFKSVLPLLAEGGEEERVLVVESPLSELVDWTIELHRHPDFPGAVVDEKHRVYFEAIKRSLTEVIGKIDRIRFAVVDEKGEED